MPHKIVVITDEMANAVCESADRLEALGVPKHLAVAIARVSATNARIAFNRGKEAGREEVLKTGIVLRPLALDEQDEVYIGDYIDTILLIHNDMNDQDYTSEAVHGIHSEFVRELWAVAYGRGLCRGFHCSVAPYESAERKRTEAIVTALDDADKKAEEG